MLINNFQTSDSKVPILNDFEMRFPVQSPPILGDLGGNPELQPHQVTSVKPTLF